MVQMKMFVCTMEDMAQDEGHVMMAICALCDRRGSKTASMNSRLPHILKKHPNTHAHESEDPSDSAEGPENEDLKTLCGCTDGLRRSASTGRWPR